MFVQNRKYFCCCWQTNAAFTLFSLTAVSAKEIFDLQDVGAKSKDFNNLSGKYTMELIVGDAVIENPITWLMVSQPTALQYCLLYSVHSFSDYGCFSIWICFMQYSLYTCRCVKLFPNHMGLPTVVASGPHPYTNQSRKTTDAGLEYNMVCLLTLSRLQCSDDSVNKSVNPMI